jgi:membrane peptidoglycan carboxypeptidase
LSFADAALLAGMIQAPTGYSPWRHPERAIERRNEVLDRMLLEGRIPAADCETAKTAPIGVKAQPPTAP